jgi:UDP-hydrolysing UDP-N-acetyl-D-glucosamine 2-epimerase
MKEIEGDPRLSLQVAVTGTHLRPEFGETWRQIADDGFVIDARIDMQISGDSPVEITQAMGRGLAGFADALDRLQPAVIVVLGDRYEMLPPAQAALIAGIPVAHIHGGEVTEGAFDDAIRHALTKLSHLHFVAAPDYARRVIQLGEPADRVFDYGAPGLDRLRRLAFMDREAIESDLGLKLGAVSFLASYHPVTLDPDGGLRGAAAMLEAFDAFPEATVVLTGTNADTHGRAIMKVLAAYAEANVGRVRLLQSLGSLRFLSLMKCVSALVGNSSSGIVEAPFLKVPSVNIGDRQKGRLRARSIVDCSPVRAEIEAALRKATSPEFRSVSAAAESRYGTGDASARIKDVLAHFPLQGLARKPFVDLAVRNP